VHKPITLALERAVELGVALLDPEHDDKIAAFEELPIEDRLTAAGGADGGDVFALFPLP
jgi:hypothetical protein